MPGGQPRDSDRRVLLFSLLDRLPLTRIVGEDILCRYLTVNNKIIICGSEPESQFHL